MAHVARIGGQENVYKSLLMKKKEKERLKYLYVNWS